MEPTRDEQEAPGAPASERTQPGANPDTTPFWLKDLKVPIIREPSPVLGMAGLTPSYVPAPSVPPTPVVPMPAPAPPAPAERAPVRGLVPATTAVAPPRRPRQQRRQRRWGGAPIRAPRPRRVRRTSALRACGVLLAGLGIAVPFVLGGPFGDDPPTSTQSTQSITTPSTPGTSGTAPNRSSAPTANDRAPSVVTAGPTPTSTSPPTTRTYAATTVRTPVTRSRDTRTSARRTPKPRPTTVPAALPPALPPAPPPPVQTTRPGEVLIRNARYAGRPLADVRADLLALGVTPVENWVAGTGRPHSTVIEIRPSGWVADRSIVYIWVAAS